MSCNHKSIADFSLPNPAGGDRRVWKCSNCAKEAYWTKGWQYYGAVECLKCSGAIIEEVLCPDCPAQKEDA